MNRRAFIRSGLYAGAFFSAGCAMARTSGDKPRLAMIGAGWQARNLLHQFLGQDLFVTAICDCDRVRREHNAKVVEDYYAQRGIAAPAVARVADFRDIIADPSVDAVCVAVPDHWHAYMTIAALRAGKDVYCEKPLTYCVEESKLVMAAARKYGGVLQTGAMQRSAPEFRTACEIVRNGGIGAVKFVDAHFGGPSRPHRDYEFPDNAAKEGAPNPDVDFDMWCGGAPLVKYSDRHAPRGVHNFFPHFWRYHDYFALGMCGDWGAHHLDIAQWGLGLDRSGPVRIIRSNEPPSRDPFCGGRRQSGLQMLFADGCVLQHNPVSAWGTVFYGTDGIVAVNRGRLGVWRGKGIFPDAKVRQELADGTFDAQKCVAFWSPAGKDRRAPGKPRAAQARSLLDACVTATKAFDLKHANVKLYRSLNHVADFAARCRDRGTPCSPAEVGGRAAILCQLCNLSYVHDTGFSWDPVKNDFADKTGQAAWLARSVYRNNWKVTL